jgi:hypothetical protein
MSDEEWAAEAERTGQEPEVPPDPYADPGLWWFAPAGDEHGVDDSDIEARLRRGMEERD